MNYLIFNIVLLFLGLGITGMIIWDKEVFPIIKIFVVPALILIDICIIYSIIKTIEDVRAGYL